MRCLSSLAHRGCVFEKNKVFGTTGFGGRSINPTAPQQSPFLRPECTLCYPAEGEDGYDTTDCRHNRQQLSDQR